MTSSRSIPQSAPRKSYISFLVGRSHPLQWAVVFWRCRPMGKSSSRLRFATLPSRPSERRRLPRSELYRNNSAAIAKHSHVPVAVRLPVRHSFTRGSCHSSTSRLCLTAKSLWWATSKCLPARQRVELSGCSPMARSMRASQRWWRPVDRDSRDRSVFPGVEQIESQVGGKLLLAGTFEALTTRPRPAWSRSMPPAWSIRRLSRLCTA